MALQQDFRPAFNGFNREDVVHYIEQVNAKHNAEISRLNSDIQYLQEQLAVNSMNTASADIEALEQQLQAQADRIVELEEILASAAEVTPDEQAQRIAELEAQLAALPAEDASLAEENAKLTQQVAALERQLMEAHASLAQAKEDNDGLQSLLDTALSRQSHVQSQQEAELSAYRRAERVERQAKERANQINEQVHGALADATAKVDEAAAHVAAMADEVLQQIQKLQMAVSDSKVVLKNTATSLYTIHTNDD